MTKLIIIGLLLTVCISFWGVSFASKGQSLEGNKTSPTPGPQVRSIINGKVFYPDGTPVSEALVSTFKKAPWPDNAVREFNPTTESEENGQYELEFPGEEHMNCVPGSSEKIICSQMPMRTEFCLEESVKL